MIIILDYLFWKLTFKPYWVVFLVKSYLIRVSSRPVIFTKQIDLNTFMLGSLQIKIVHYKTTSVLVLSESTVCDT